MKTFCRGHFTRRMLNNYGLEGEVRLRQFSRESVEKEHEVDLDHFKTQPNLCF